MKTTSSRMTHPIAKVISSNNFVFTSPSHYHGNIIHLVTIIYWLWPNNVQNCIVRHWCSQDVLQFVKHFLQFRNESLICIHYVATTRKIFEGPKFYS